MCITVASTTSWWKAKIEVGATLRRFVNVQVTVSAACGTLSGMTSADISDLNSGNLYVNVHSSGRPTGDIWRR